LKIVHMMSAIMVTVLVLKLNNWEQVHPNNQCKHEIFQKKKA
jgi:hypothetical protein